MLPADIQKVALVSLPRQFMRSMDDTGHNEQIIRSTEAEGALFMFDTYKGLYNSFNKSVNIDTKNLFQHYDRMKLTNVQACLHIYNINEYNKVINMKLYNTGNPAGVTDFTMTLTEGYYDINDFVTHLTTKFQALTTSLISHDGGGAFNNNGTFTLASNLSTSTNHRKILFTADTGGTYTWAFDSSVKNTFGAFGAHLAPFDTNLTCIQGGTITSGICYMLYSRYLRIRCNELTRQQPIHSFDSEDHVGDLVVDINLNENLQTSNRSTVDFMLNTDYVIMTRSNRLDSLNFIFEDEWGNRWPFGYTLGVNGVRFPNPNQIKLTFITTD